MAEMKPILFCSEMVRAILEGRKTQTRRIVKPQPGGVLTKEQALARALDGTDPYGFRPYPLDTEIAAKAPYQPGDVLYVRETWQRTKTGQYIYRADKEDHGSAAYYNEHCRLDGGWRPSIHMPREAAQLFLRVTDVRVERLRDIDENGAIAEGLYKGWRLCGMGSLALSARQAFMWLWETITRKAPAADSWACNPWVWVYTFERCEKEDNNG